MGLGTATRHGHVIGGSRGRHMCVAGGGLCAGVAGQECVPYTYPLPGEPAPDRGAGGMGFRGHEFNCIPLSRTGSSTPGPHKKKKAVLEKYSLAK